MKKEEKTDVQENIEADNWHKFYELNNYYHKSLQNLTQRFIPEKASVLEFDCRSGEILSFLKNKNKTGVDENNKLLSIAKSKHKNIGFYNLDQISKKLKGNKFDYIVLSHTLSKTFDVQGFINKIKVYCHEDTKIIVFYFNFLWKPVIDVAERLGLKLPSNYVPNWLSRGDVINFLDLEDIEEVKSGSSFLFPLKLFVFSEFINRYIAPLPFFNSLCLENYSIFRVKKKKKDYSISILIPARNEAGHMKGVIKRIPIFAKKMEIIFVEGHSKDDTYEVIKDEMKNYKGPIKTRLFKQKGKGKGDAVRLGFSKAENELLMILDADLTVDPKELQKFYNIISSGKADFAMGSRLVYPMEDLAMRDLNVLGNKFFSIVFSFLLDQRIKDTLCGTKVLLKSDYEKIAKNRIVFGDFDPFGDFDLIFGASKLNLKIVEIPIRYKERVYGNTNISRFSHGFLLLKMVLFAAKKIKFV